MSNTLARIHIELKVMKRFFLGALYCLGSVVRGAHGDETFFPRRSPLINKFPRRLSPPRAQCAKPSDDGSSRPLLDLVCIYYIDRYGPFSTRAYMTTSS